MNDTFLRACRGEKTEYTPVWLMRQGGRSIPRFNEMMREHGFLDICRIPELAAEATMIPIDAFGVDAVILFSDILTTVVPMGMEMTWDDRKGPGFNNPIRTAGDVARLSVPDAEDAISFVMQAADICKRELVDKVPNIGFAWAPFTVAMYMVEGGPSARFHQARKMMFEAPEVFEALVAKVAEMTTGYVLGQVRHGVDAMIMFDSLAKMVSKEEYDRFALPYAQKTFAAVKATGVPTLYYLNGFTSLATSIKQVDVDVYGLDWRTTINQILHMMGNDIVIQGNLDPYALFAPEDAMRARVQSILDQASRARGHVFNLGEGIMPETPVAKARAMVDAVHELSRK